MNRRTAVRALSGLALAPTVGAGCGGIGDLTVDDEPLVGRPPVSGGGPMGAQCPAGSAAGASMVAGPAAETVPLYGQVSVTTAVGMLMVGRDEQGLFAVDPRCTHQGCPTKLSKAGLWECPCHGSRFHYNGDRLDGPAKASLTRYPVCTLADGSTLIKIRG